MSRNISISITDATGKNWTFEKIRSLVSFCKKEEKNWDDIYTNIDNPSNVHQYIKVANAFTQILSDINTFKDIEDDAQFNQRIQQLQRNHLNQLASRWLWSGQPFISSWIESYKFSAQTGNAFIEALLQKRTNSNQDFHALKGYILAYEFELQDESELTQRRNTEKKSIAQLRNHLSKKTSELIEEVDEFKDDFSTWHDKTQKSLARKVKAQKAMFCKLEIQRKEEFDLYMKESKTRISELENTYQEKLRLEKPATYWKTKASLYKRQGLFWSAILFILLLSGIGGFGYLFVQWMESKSLGIELKSLQGALIFVTILTIYAFLIKSLSKLVFSSFHLQRDAEEREQLTHVYLALTHEEGKIDEDSRKIVLQALFSRADSGLLHRDSSPTMPGLHDLMKASNLGK